MHTLDGFLCGWKIVYDIGLLKIILGFLPWLDWLPLNVSLGQLYAVSSALISFANENGVSLECYQHILFFVNRDVFPGDDGHISNVGCFANNN